jgi:uncharacterized membrane protein YeiH
MQLPVARRETLLAVLDLLGVFVFAVEGAMAAVGGSFDALGVLVLSFSTALGGGIVRDVLIGATPVAAIKDVRYPITAFVGGGLVFLLHGIVAQIPHPVLVGFDALGLSLCAVAGATKARGLGIHPLPAVLLGAVTGVGGGTIRDLLMARSPTVLHSDIYAVAAMFGAAVMLTAIRGGIRGPIAATLGATACFVLRVVSVWRNWNLPKL